MHRKDLFVSRKKLFLHRKQLFVDKVNKSVCECAAGCAQLYAFLEESDSYSMTLAS